MESFAEEQTVDSNEQTIQLEVIDTSTVNSPDSSSKEKLGINNNVTLPSMGDISASVISFLGFFVIGLLSTIYLIKKRGSRQ